MFLKVSEAPKWVEKQSLSYLLQGELVISDHLPFSSMLVLRRLVLSHGRVSR